MDQYFDMLLTIFLRDDEKLLKWLRQQNGHIKLEEAAQAARNFEDEAAAEYTQFMLNNVRHREELENYRK